MKKYLSCSPVQIKYVKLLSAGFRPTKHPHELKHGQGIDWFCAGLASHPSEPPTTAETLLERTSQSHQIARTNGPGALVIANP
jgi:hypothetical protein